MHDLSYYQKCFSTLHTAKSKGFFAPHKPLLLLSIIDLIESGLICSNRIELNDTLVATFKSNVTKYIGRSAIFDPNIGQPFYHLLHEPFWHLSPAPDSEEEKIATTSQNGKKKVNYSISSLRANYRYALIDPELFYLLQDNEARSELRKTLTDKYISTQPSSILPIALLTVYMSMLSLIA
jgi:putative restriction endonuclease